MQTAHKWGQPLWQVEFSGPAVPLPAKTDVAIVGAGFTGLSAAWHLRRDHPDWRVTVLEAESVGSGASGRTGGIVLDNTAAGPVPGFAHSLEFAAEFVSREQIECGWNTPGCWEVSHNRSIANGPLDWNDEGAPLRVARVVPGGTVDPGRLVSGLARAALAAGATIHEHCELVSLDFGPLLRVHTPGGSLPAGWVVLATNAYSCGLSEMEEHGTPLLTLAAATEPLEESMIAKLGMASRRPFYTEDLPYLWGRLTAGNRMVVGSGLISAKEGDVAAVSLEETEAPRLFADLERRIRGLHPVLSRISFTHRWAGPIVITDDWRPVLRAHSRSPRVLVAGGYSGHGIAQSIRMGRLLTDRLSA